MRKTSPSSSSEGNNFEREQYLYLTTRGRKSGLPREIEIWFTQHNGRFYVIAEYETSHWVQNLCANPTAKMRIRELTLPVAARILSSESESKLKCLIQDLSRKKYGWGEGLVIELVPESSHADIGR